MTHNPMALLEVQMSEETPITVSIREDVLNEACELLDIAEILVHYRQDNDSRVARLAMAREAVEVLQTKMNTARLLLMGVIPPKQSDAVSVCEKEGS